MKKQILNLGNTLSKEQLNKINGGGLWCYDYVLKQWVYVSGIGGVNKKCPEF
ncbi:hypothetical protein OAT18_02385 [Tenacibaculum sp.]|nr:hypothetical protein [Tenacibaculum sp.]